MSQREKPWGIDVTVQFTDSKTGELINTTMFRFDDEKQIEDELAERMKKAIANIQYELDLPYEMSYDEARETIADVKSYVNSNIVGSEKDELINILEKYDETPY